MVPRSRVAVVLMRGVFCDGGDEVTMAMAKSRRRAGRVLKAQAKRWQRYSYSFGCNGWGEVEGTVKAVATLWQWLSLSVGAIASGGNAMAMVMAVSNSLVLATRWQRDGSDCFGNVSVEESCKLHGDLLFRAAAALVARTSQLAALNAATIAKQTMVPRTPAYQHMTYCPEIGSKDHAYWLCSPHPPR